MSYKSSFLGGDKILICGGALNVYPYQIDNSQEFPKISLDYPQSIREIDSEMTLC